MIWDLLRMEFTFCECGHDSHWHQRHFLHSECPLLLSWPYGMSTLTFLKLIVFFSSTSLGTLIPHQILVPHIAFLFNTITWKAELLRWSNPDCLSIESWYSKEWQGCVPSTQSRTVKASMCRCSFNPLSTAWIPCFLTVAPAAVLTPGLYHQIKNIPLLKYYLKCSDKWFNLPVKVRFWGPHFSRLRDTQALWGW